MSPRRHADDDAGAPGLADALARWDMAQDWMRAQDDAASDPAGWQDPADRLAGPAPTDAAVAPDAAPVAAPEAARDSMPGRTPPGAAMPPSGQPTDPDEPARLPWAAQNPSPERWRRRPGLDDARPGSAVPTQSPAPGGWQLPPPPSAPVSWDALLSEGTSHAVKETQPMSTSAPGGEAHPSYEPPQPAAPDGEQSSAEPDLSGHDPGEQEPPFPPVAPGFAGRPGPEAAPLPWESTPPRRQQAESPGPARRPDDLTELMQPPATQTPPWESPGWGGPPAPATDQPVDERPRAERSTGAQPAVASPAADQPPDEPAGPGGSSTGPTVPGATAVADTGAHPGGEPPANGPTGGWPGQSAVSTTAPTGSQPAGPPPVGAPPSPQPPAAYGGSPAMAWPLPRQRQQGAGPVTGTPDGTGERVPAPDQSGRPWGGAAVQFPPAPQQPQRPSQPPQQQLPQQLPPQQPQQHQGWPGQWGGGTPQGYDPRWAGAQPPGDVPVWAPPGERGAPTVEDLTAQSLIRQRKRAPQTGWRKALYTLSAHSLNPGEAPSEVRRRELMERATVPVRGCYRIAVISLKGGVGKTTMTVCLGATLASLRGDRVIAVDANPDRGTLSGKLPMETVATVRNLLNDANRIGRYSDVRRYTSQSPDRLEVLASESDPAVSIAFSEQDYRVVAGILERYYNVVLTDCGTGLLHSAMSGVLALANQLVLVSSGSVDGARSASATLDWLEAHGYRSLVAGSVAVINSVRPKSGGVDLDKLHEHFAARCRSVVRVPYDPHLEEGAEVDLSALREETRYALLELAAYTADGFGRDGGTVPRPMLEQARPHQPQLP